MMSFRDLDIKRSYISMGEDSIAPALICPALRLACRYDRSVGFFSSGVLASILPGLVDFYRNNGHIRLICSPQLSNEDIAAIDAGYAQREAILQQSFEHQFESEMQNFDDSSLQLLYELIVRGTLDIQIAYTSTSGTYHDKMGILTSAEGDAIAFYGSANSSENGYRNNYERIRVTRSWIPGEDEYVKDEQDEFEKLWAGTHPYVKVLAFRESAERSLFEVIERRRNRKSASEAITLRSYQEQAIQAWVDNQYHGFFVMATGTGKTWTAIYAAKRLVQKERALIVICAPYKHLVRQWAEDVQTAFPSAKIVLVSSENPKWESTLTEAVIRNRYEPDCQIIVISTIVSFHLDRFTQTINKAQGKRLLIVDEAHRFANRSDSLKGQYQFLLGLSATPYSGKSTDAGDALMAYFGGRVFNLPIEDALGKYLVNYYYHPLFVNATEDEENRFHALGAKIMSCFRNGVLIDPEGLYKHRRNRLRVISMAQEKIKRIGSILSKVEEKDHLVVYCGDGRLFDDNRQLELRHIQYMKGILTQFGYRASQFTASENMDKRMELVDAFNKGEITAMAAIRCLDEGINIPSIKSALILSSNDDYREFVQRRGRILRQYKGKESAHIYDVIVLPSTATPKMAEIELRRYLEYARLALNSEELLKDLDMLMGQYQLTDEQIAMASAENEEEILDE